MRCFAGREELQRPIYGKDPAANNDRILNVACRRQLLYPFADAVTARQEHGVEVSLLAIAGKDLETATRSAIHCSHFLRLDLHDDIGALPQRLGEPLIDIGAECLAGHERMIDALAARLLAPL